MSIFQTDPPAPDACLPETPEAAIETLAQLGQDYLAQSASRFETMLTRVVARLVGDGEAAEQALADGGFVMNDTTVVIRRNPDTDHIEFFCDVGMPESHSQDAAYRTALELNLCRAYPGIVLGAHPESGRLVATTQIHGLLVADEDACINMLEMLTLQVRRLRDSRVFALDLS